MSKTFYSDTTYENKSVFKYSIQVGSRIIGNNDLDELIEHVLDRGIDPNNKLWVDGKETEQTLFEYMRT